MRLQIFIRLSLILCCTVYAQTPLQRLESVPIDFIERYKQEYHEYNPLHVGDLWQFVGSSGNINEIKVDNDTIVNNTKYFRKLDMFFPYDSTYFYLERNDSAKSTTYRLDIEDLDEDGDSLDEVLLDSLEVPRVTTYLSYRHTWKNGDPFPKLPVVIDSFWVVVYGDTVISRIVSFLAQDELVADKYGVVQIYPEGSPPLLLTGMIINGVTYGNIVNIDKPQESFPSKFKLFNNYPNPFNPTTTITYSIQKDGLVSLKVYDILGKEVASLVNEPKIAGTYNVEFNASNLPSGIYFYRIRAGAFVDTKKLILLK